MVKVFQYRPDHRNYSSLEFEEPKAIEVMTRICLGKGQWDEAMSMAPLKVSRSTWGYHVSERNTLPDGDTPGLFTGFMVLSDRAAKCLRKFLDGNTVLVPLLCLDCGDWQYSLAGVTRVLDALDRSQSDLKCFRDGRITELRRPVFREEMVRDVPLFQIPGYRAEIFLTDRIIDQIVQTGLTGFDCPQVWPPPDPEIEREKFRQKRFRKKRFRNSGRQ